MSTLVRTVKEVARHALHTSGLARHRSHHLEREGRAERFSEIYESGIWQCGNDKLPLSGSGSSLEATATIRRELPGLLKRIGTRTMLDVGCGDMTWMQTIDLGVDYIGVDIVQSVIQDNRAKFPGSSFYCLDAVNDPLPQADTILCREVLFHLSFTDAWTLLRNMRSAGVLWLIATTDRGTWFNSDIETGDFRMLNLNRAPFRFPEAEIEISDDGNLPDRRLGAWPYRSVCPEMSATGHHP